MIRCFSCATPAENSAKFCCRCGLALKNFAIICPTLVALLDGARNHWFELTQKLVSDMVPLPRNSILYTSFLKTNVVAMSEDATPTSFPFNTVDGETLEAAVIFIQLEGITRFAMNVKSYFGMDQLADFTEKIVKSTIDKPRWGLSVAGGVSDQPVDLQCISEITAHFLLNNPKECEIVRKVREVLTAKGIPLLVISSCMATAIAFGDPATMDEIAVAISG